MTDPQTRAPSSASRSVPSHATPRGAITSILLVDDQPARLLSYEAVLSGLEVNCVKALSGAEALAKILKQEFAAILLDVSMPEMDGFEVARLIRTHPRLERTPILFVTAVNMTEFDRLKGYEVGAIDYLAVPIAPEILRSKVAILVELYLRRRELQQLTLSQAEARSSIDKKHAEALRDREAELGAVFEHPTELISVLEAQRAETGKIVSWVFRRANTNVLNTLGLTRTSLIGRELGEILGARGARVGEACARVLESGKFECDVDHADGRDYRITTFPIGRDRVVRSGVDITDARRAETALRESERRYRAIMENAPVGVAHNSMEGKFEYVNKAFCDCVGYSAEELLGKTWQEITHPEDLATDAALGNRVLMGELPYYNLEKRYRRKDGALVWVQMFGNFVRGDDGKPIQGVAVAIDVTERRRADIALRDSEETLRLAKRAARLGTHDWDIRSGILKWDDHTRELWGIEPGQPVNLEVFYASLHPNDRHATEEEVQRALDPKGDGRFCAIFRIINRINGLVRWIEATGRVSFENGRAVRLVGTAQDITERRIAHQKLREGEERFRELANNIDQFAWTCDEMGQASWFNDRWYEYTGTNFEEMRGEGSRNVVAPAHADRVLAHFQECLKAGHSWEDTYPLRGRNGEYRWFLSRAVPIRDAHDRVVRWFGTNTDVTELRQLQEELKAADRRKDEFLAMLAHELRNPVAPIVSATEVLRHSLADERQRSLLDLVQRQTTHLSRLLDDLLDVARITQGRIELKTEVVDFRACLNMALETANYSQKKPRPGVLIEQSADPLHVRADNVRIAQCLGNLLSNAQKFTPADEEIRIRSFRDGADAVVEIADSGIGISAELLPHIFGLFVQGERTLDRSQGGLGVGLAICRQVMDLHGGSILAASAGAGRGSTFTARLPLVATEPVVQRTRSSLISSRRKVLIVDDNRDAADTLALLLQLEGHAPTAVYSSEQALEAVQILSPQVVVLDIGLPGMDGYEVARRMRLMAPHVRLIALTGYGRPEDEFRAKEAGFDVHMVKPVDSTAFNTAIEALL